MADGTRREATSGAAAAEAVEAVEAAAAAVREDATAAEAAGGDGGAAAASSSGGDARRREVWLLSCSSWRSSASLSRRCSRSSPLASLASFLRNARDTARSACSASTLASCCASASCIWSIACRTDLSFSAEIWLTRWSHQREPYESKCVLNTRANAARASTTSSHCRMADQLASAAQFRAQFSGRHSGGPAALVAAFRPGAVAVHGSSGSPLC